MGREAEPPGDAGVATVVDLMEEYGSPETRGVTLVEALF
jgi:hypothetical protein